MRKWLALAATVVMALGVVACGSDDSKDSGGGGDLSGNIRIDGSSTVQPFAEAALELFEEDNPNVRITVGGAGTGDGFEKFCRGETDISDASRAIEPDEEKLCKSGKVTPTEVQVANDGITVVTNKELKVDCLTTAQLKKIFGKSATATNLKDVDPKLPDSELALYTPGTESGTFDFFTEQINGEEGVQRTDGIQTSADDNVLVTGVSGEKGGLGYFGFSFFEQNQDKLNPVKVDGGSGCVEPSSETIQSGEYKPLARPLFMYPSEKALKKPEVKAFLEYITANYQEIAEVAKIVPMSEEQATEAKSAIGG